MTTARPVKLLVATTVPESAWGLLRGQLRHLREHGYDVVLVSSPGAQLEAVADREGVRVLGVPMRRQMNVAADLRSLWRLLRMFRSERPDVAMLGTPKAALLGGIAARLTGVPLRIYLLRGLRLETTRGPARFILWLCERLTAANAHEVLSVSPSLLDEARRLRIVGPGRGRVLGRGGSNGIAAKSLRASPASDALRNRVDPDGTRVIFGFVGRVTGDKGIRELLDAFEQVSRRLPQATLLVVGGTDGTDLDEATLERLATHPAIDYLGWLDDPSIVYPAIDVFVLPTHREGLPTVCLEASAAGRPVITTLATGARDAVVPGDTGLLVPVADADALADAMVELGSDPETRRRMGEAGRSLTTAHFTNEVVWENLRRFLDERLRAATIGTRPHVATGS